MKLEWPGDGSVGLGQQASAPQLAVAAKPQMSETHTPHIYRVNVIALVRQPMTAFSEIKSNWPELIKY